MGGGASREKMLVWVAEVQIPKVEQYLREAQRRIKQPLKYLNLPHSPHYFYCFASHVFRSLLSLHPSDLSAAPSHWSEVGADAHHFPRLLPICGP